MEKLIVVIEGPGGVGKDSILDGLVAKYPTRYERFITVTTRPMRENERQGHPYNFVTEAEFKKRLESGDIFESTYRHNTYRGMSRKLIDKVLDNGKVAVGSVDILGMPHVKRIYGKSAKFVFIKAPRDVLEARLKKRGDSESERQSRLAEYDSYMATEMKYDTSIENIDLQKAIDDLHKLVLKYQERNHEQKNH